MQTEQFTAYVSQTSHGHDPLIGTGTLLLGIHKKKQNPQTFTLYAQVCHNHVTADGNVFGSSLI